MYNDNVHYLPGGVNVLVVEGSRVRARGYVFGTLTRIHLVDLLTRCLPAHSTWTRGYHGLGGTWSAATTIPPKAGEAAPLWWGHRALVFRKRRRVADSLPAHSTWARGYHGLGGTWSAATTIPPKAGEAAPLWWGHRALVFRKRRRVADSLPAHSKWYKLSSMSDTASDMPGKWHHAPEHRLDEAGAFMVTCGTLHKKPVLTDSERLDEFQHLLFKYAKKFGWRLQAWAILSNHYHWIGLSPSEQSNAHSLKLMTTQLHEASTKRLNRSDLHPGRRIWYNYWDSHITYANSYYARLKYVHDNPVHHGIVKNAANYRWCSRAWLERTAKRAFIRQLDGFKTDRLQIPDDY